MAIVLVTAAKQTSDEGEVEVRGQRSCARSEWAFGDALINGPVRSGDSCISGLPARVIGVSTDAFVF